MTLRLTIDERAWRDHVDTVRRAVDGLVPVVKGNGYGFGRATLAAVAAAAGEIAVGHGGTSWPTWPTVARHAVDVTTSSR